jgi:hypothetical protein
VAILSPRNAGARFGNGHAALAGVSCLVVRSWRKADVRRIS